MVCSIGSLTVVVPVSLESRFLAGAADGECMVALHFVAKAQGGRGEGHRVGKQEGVAQGHAEAGTDRAQPEVTSGNAASRAVHGIVLRRLMSCGWGRRSGTAQAPPGWWCVMA